MIKMIFISEKEVNAWLRRINKKYNISKENLHNHRLRHDRITQWKEAHIDMDAIQYLAGHITGSNITEDVYIDTSADFAFNELKKKLIRNLLLTYCLLFKKTNHTKH